MMLHSVLSGKYKNMICPQTEPEEGAAESSVKSEVDVKKQLFTTDAETNTVSSSGQSNH